MIYFEDIEIFNSIIKAEGNDISIELKECQNLIFHGVIRYWKIYVEYKHSNGHFNKIAICSVDEFDEAQIWLDLHGLSADKIVRLKKDITK